MTESSFAQEDVDFEAAYQGGTPFGETMPWDIGRPQPVLVSVVDAGQVKGAVLDIGCGLGNNSILLASRGFQVTGVDGAPTALAKARERAGDLDIDFQVGDATKLEGLENRFDTVIDSALYHCLNEEDRHKYMAALHRATRPGAVLHLFCFSDAMPDSFPGPFRISEQNLRETVGRMWTITHLAPALYDTSTSREEFVGMIRATLSDADTPDGVLDHLEVDDEGRLRVPMWQLTATRA
jgi:SAM-dependent methyltransferase